MFLLVATLSTVPHHLLSALLGPGRTRRVSRAASLLVPATTLVGAVLYRRHLAHLDLISPTPGSPIASQPLPGTTWTRTVLRTRRHAHREHTTRTPVPVHRLTVLTQALAITWTNLGKAARPHAPRAPTIPTLDPAHQLTAYSPARGTTCLLRAPAVRPSVPRESTNHQPANPRAFGLIRDITWTLRPQLARPLARRDNTSLTQGRVDAFPRAEDTLSSRQLLLGRHRVPPELTIPTKGRW